MTRAFLSVTEAERPGTVRVFVAGRAVEMGATWAEFAEREARAILAETEPGPFRWDAMMDEELSGLHPVHRKALAAALAAFVGEGH